MRIEKNTKILLGNTPIVKIKKGGTVIWEYNSQPVVEPEYFYIESLTDGNTVTFITNLKNTSHSSYITPTIEYSTDKQNWTTVTFDWSTYGIKNINIPVVLNTGDKMYFRNDTGKFSRTIYDGVSYDTSYITLTTGFYGRVNVGGDIRTLINYRNVDNTILEDGMFSNLFSHTYGGTITTARIVDASSLELPATTTQYCYQYMFWSCSSLTTAPALPATTLAEYCYSDMFRGCTALVTPPELPVTTLVSNCYYNMFYGCTSLTTAPALPATTLAERCYTQMFQGCTSLTTAPALPATTLTNYCYYGMFSGCTSLTSAPVLPATTLAGECYEEMFRNCTSLTTAPILPATTLTDGCYKNMFRNCTSLTSAPALIATTMTNDCYGYMFSGCTSLNKILVYADSINSSAVEDWLSNVAATGTFYNAGSATYTTDSSSGIPTGWTEVSGVPATSSVYAVPDTFSAKSWMEKARCNYTVIGTNSTGIDVPLSNESQSLTIGQNTGSSTVTHTETLTYDGMDYTITINQSANDTDEPNYFYVETIDSDNVVNVNNYKYGNQSVSDLTPTIEYSTDKVNWNVITLDWTNTGLQQTISLNNAGDKVYFRNDTGLFSNTENTSRYKHIYFTFGQNKQVNVGGDLRSLLDYSDVNNANVTKDGMFRGLFSPNNYSSLSTEMMIVDASSLELPATTTPYCYYNMLQGCTALTTAPAVLPATTLAQNCYEQMFKGCTALTTAPALPATNLAKSCYNSIFQGCTALTTAPELPATTLAEYCYSNMFLGCTALVTPPELPVTTLVSNCYYNMFYGCTSLTTAPSLPATTLEKYCYSSMFQGCTSLTTAPALPATTLANMCYQSMFRGCTALTSAPALPATTLVQSCYSSMFYGCTALTSAPALPATTLSDSCYSNMFRECSSLTTAPELPATTLAEYCYSNMFNSCTSLATAPALPATTLEGGCYQSMFYSTALTTAPELPATTLVTYCYNSMFNSCSSLNSVTTFAQDIPASSCLSNWLSGVASSGTFNNYGFITYPSGNNGIPTGWTEVIPTIQSIVADPDTFTLKSYQKSVRCESTLTITTTGGVTVTKTNSVTLTVGENTGDSTRTLTEMIPYENSSYQVTIVQTANDPVTKSWSVSSTSTYPFELNSNDYYESTNKGVNNSYSYAVLDYEGYDELVLECINSGENNYDYGIVSQPDVELSESITDDGATGSEKVFHNFKGESSRTPVQLTIPSDKGSHFITIKFRKDSSSAAGKDSLQFKVIEPTT